MSNHTIVIILVVKIFFVQGLGIVNKEEIDIFDGVVTQLEPDILKCEVKWTLGSITTNKASEGDGIPLELFQS